MDVEMSFDLERDKCLKILLIFFLASRAKGKKKNKKSEKLNRLPDLYTYEYFKKKLTLEKISKAPTLGPFYFNLGSPLKLKYLSIRFPVFPSLLICVQKF